MLSLPDTDPRAEINTHMCMCMKVYAHSYSFYKIFTGFHEKSVICTPEVSSDFIMGIIFKNEHSDHSLSPFKMPTEIITNIVKNCKWSVILSNLQQVTKIVSWMLAEVTQFLNQS